MNTFHISGNKKDPLARQAYPEVLAAKNKNTPFVAVRGESFHGEYSLRGVFEISKPPRGALWEYQTPTEWLKGFEK